MPTVAVLVPPIHSTTPPPQNLPIAHALSSIQHKLQVVFGYEMKKVNNTVWIKGLSIDNNEWKETIKEIDVVHDRFPSQIRNKVFKQLHLLTSHLPWGNPLQTTLLCRDKLQCQRILEPAISMPEVVDNPELFRSALDNWGTGFLKPRFGALGIGDEQVSLQTKELPSHLPSVVPGALDPSILQKSIAPPRGTMGMSIRQLVQKDQTSCWIPRTAVLRTSMNSPVVNVAQGAQASAAKSTLPTETIQSIQTQSINICEILDSQPSGSLNVEFGLDFVIDKDYRPWLIEVNSRPRGRLEHLAKQFPEEYLFEHREACIQPIRTLASLIS